VLNVLGVNGVRPTEIHTAVPLEPALSAFGIWLAIKKLKITTELIRGGGRTVHSEIHVTY
jgi:hypothetical protein